jgi:hypothetical protein
MDDTREKRGYCCLRRRIRASTPTAPDRIMETLGHSQIGLTLNTSSHLRPALQHDAAAKVDAVLRVRGFQLGFHPVCTHPGSAGFVEKVVR